MDATFHIMTFGCQMNVNDSLWLAHMLKAKGFSEAGLDDASIILLNTCSVREKPEARVKNLIGRIQSRQVGKNCEAIAVLGCVAQQLGHELFDCSSLVRLVVGADGLVHAPAALGKILSDPDARLAFLDFSSAYDERPLNLQKRAASSAFVSIMRGCDNFCSYCIVPFTRGRQKSRDAGAIEAECSALIDNGVLEICLLGQNVNAYGKDGKNGGVAFSRLLQNVAQIPGLERLRFVTPHPADFGEDTIETFARYTNLCPRLHLPMQAGSDRVLKGMRRRYTRKDFLLLVKKLKDARPDLALSTDIIVGFPGETEADFQETLELVGECGFMASYSFCYSDRPGTRASKMSDKIPDDVKGDRLIRLQQLQDKLGEDWLARRVGSRTSILIEGLSPRNDDQKSWWQGRDPYGTVINVQLENGNEKFGHIVEVVIEGSRKHSLIGKWI